MCPHEAHFYNRNDKHHTLFYSGDELSIGTDTQRLDRERRRGDGGSVQTRRERERVGREMAMSVRERER